MGIKEVLRWIKGRQLSDVVVETECLVAVQVIRVSSTLLSYFGRIIQELKVLPLELKDKGMFIRFIKRSAKNVAHFLVSYSYSLADRRG